MKDNDRIPLTEFDIATCGTYFQMIKAYIPYVDCKMQRMLALFIRIWELMKTLEFYDNLSNSPLSRSCNDWDHIIDEIKVFCPSKDCEILKSISMYQKFSQMNSSNPITSFMSPEQQVQYNNYKKMLDNLNL